MAENKYKIDKYKENELSHKEIEKSREIVENMGYTSQNNGFGIGYARLDDMLVVYQEATENWVGFRLVYAGSGSDLCNELDMDC